MTQYDERLADLEEMGVDLQVVKPLPPQCYYTVPIEIADKASRMVNDGLAEYVARKRRSLRRLRDGSVAGRCGRRGRTRTFREKAGLQGRTDPDKRRRPRAFRSDVCARSGPRPSSSACWSSFIPTDLRTPIG